MDPAVVAAWHASPLVWLSTVGPDGPNLVPVGFRALWEGKPLLVDLYFGKTRQNLAANPRVALGLATASPKTGFQLKGTASLHTHGPAWEAAREVLRESGVSADPRAAVVVEVDEIYLLDPGADAGRRIG